MIDGLRPYSEMKASGLAWLGDVPAHWDVRRIKTLLSEVDNRTRTGTERLLSLRMRQGLVDHIDAGGKLIPPESLVNFKIVEPGQVVMNRMRAAAGLFGVASVRGLVSPDYAVFEPKPEAFNPYLLQAFRLPSLSAVFRAESKGLGTGESGFLRLYTDRFGPIPVPYPPLDEQRLVVRFLDWHGAQTAKLIRAKKKIIALLNEQKQAIIHRAVTRGLDPNVKLKPSGISWLGDVPKKWDVSSLSSLSLSIQTGPFGSQLPASNYVQGGIPLINPSHIVGGSIVPDASISISEETAQRLSRHRFEAGEVVIARRGEIGRCAVISEKERGWICGTGSIKLRLQNTKLLPDYCALLFSDSEVRAALKLSSVGATMDNLNEGMIGRLRLPVPTLREQAGILKAVAAMDYQIGLLIGQAEQEIEFIREFRIRLVADVVTGKLDVRAAASTLPEITDADAIEDIAEDEDLDDSMDELKDKEVAA
jgi:type I restriction enzyme S subunit